MNGDFGLTSFFTCGNILSMDFKAYLQETKQTPNAFASANKLPSATTWRAAHGKPLQPVTARKYVKATGGAVTLEELLFPDTTRDD